MHGRPDACGSVVYPFSLNGAYDMDRTIGALWTAVLPYKELEKSLQRIVYCFRGITLGLVTHNQITFYSLNHPKGGQIYF